MPKPYFAPQGPRVFAHRGLAFAPDGSPAAPENTAAAFADAIAIGAAYVETDVHASSDGIAVISHDPSLDRVAGRPGRVSDLTLAQLQAIDLGGGQGFRSLAAVLAEFPATRFNIDIKSLDAVQPTVDAILAADASDRVLVTSFSEARRVAAVRQLPGVATSAGASRFAVALLAGKVGLSPVVRRALRGLVAVQVPEKAIGLRITTARMIQRLHDAGVEVHVWTVNDPLRMAELLDLGVDGLVTDRADLALAVVASRS